MDCGCLKSSGGVITTATTNCADSMRVRVFAMSSGESASRALAAATSAYKTQPLRIPVMGRCRHSRSRFFCLSLVLSECILVRMFLIDPLLVTKLQR